MNNDLISRKTLLNEFDTKCQRMCPACEYHKWNSKLKRYECELINTAPPVETKECPYDCESCAKKAICEMLGENSRPKDEITEEQAIDKLHETGWLIEHDKEMTTRPTGDCISREALKKAIKDNGYSHYFEIFEIIDNAQAVPLPNEQIAWEQGYEAGLAQGKQDRPQGEWINLMETKGYVVCPFCGKEITGGDLNFCVKCGADMRGGAE